MMEATSSDSTRSRSSHAGAVLAVVAVVMVCHLWSLGDGLFLDDHVIRDNLARSGWTWDDLTEAATLEIPGSRDTVWWQTAPWQWRNARPVAMFINKIEWLLAGDRVWIVHAFGVAWHAACALLVYALVLTLYGGRGLAVGAGCFFAMNPHSPFPVSWIAAQNGLICTAFVLLSLLCYIRATGLPVGITTETRRSRREQGYVRAAGLPVGTEPGESHTHRVHAGWLVAGLLAWAMALFSKEIAVVVPFLIAGLDLTLGGVRRLARRWWIHLVSIGILVAFLFWRLAVFPDRAPPIMYFHHPSGLDGLLWYFAKLVHQLLAITTFTPLIGGPITPDGRPIHWGLVTLMAVPSVAILLWYLWSWPTGRRGRWYWPAFVVMGLVPVLPVFARPDLAYLPFAGYAMMIAVILARLRGRARVMLNVVIVAVTLWSFGLYRVAWEGTCRTEQLLVSDAVESPPPPGCTELFFIDLPFADAYAPLALRTAWNRDELTGHVLTLAPHPLKMMRASTITQLDPHRLRVELESPGYFSGPIGRMFLQAMRPGGIGGQWHGETTTQGELFDATVIRADSGDILGFEFTFHRPLDSERLFFFRGTPARPAAPVRFRSAAGSFPWTVPPPDPASPAQREWESRHAGALAASRRLFALMDIVQNIIQSDVYLTGND